MTEQVSVVEDGVASEQPRNRGTTGWIMAVVGFAMGLSLGVLFANPAPDATSPAAAGPSGDNASDSVAAPETEGVAGAVPDFPDTLVAIASPPGSALDHLLWPRSGELQIRSMTGGDDVALDASGRYVALSRPVPGTSGVVLSMGRLVRIANIASGVTSYVWHDREPGLLAYTTESDGLWRLFVVGPDLVPELIIETSDLGGPLVGFGDWGWAVQTSPAAMTLLTPDGEVKAVEVGVGYASHPDGWVFMMDDGPKLVTGGGGINRIDASLQVGFLSAVAISPDRSHVAIAFPTGWSVVDLSSGAVDYVGLAPSTLAWSSDSRFVIAAGTGAVIYDVETGTSYPVLGNRQFVAVGTAPLRDS